MCLCNFLGSVRSYICSGICCCFGLLFLDSGLGFLNYDADIANVVGYNGGDSQDQLAADVLYAGTNVLYEGGAANRAALTTGDEITAHGVRTAVATLRSNSAMGWDGMTYAGCIHPDVSLDLREEEALDVWPAGASWPRSFGAQRLAYFR